MEKQNVKVKGHGFFRKTKAYGLACGIALGATLLFGANVASADEVKPNQPAATEVVANAKPVATEAQAKPVEVPPSESATDAKPAAREAQAKPVEVAPSENAANATPVQATSDDPTNFRNREVVNKVENTQTPSNEPDSEGTYNSQIKSVESLTPDEHKSSDAYRYRMTLHDGYAIPANGKITFYGSNNINVTANDLYFENKKIGTITKEKMVAKNHQEIWDKFANATTVKEAKAVLDNALNSELTGYAKYTIKFNEEFAKLDRNRVIEFELISDIASGTTSTVQETMDKNKWSVFIKNNAPAQLLPSSFTPSYDGRNEKTLLTFDGIKEKALKGTKHHLNIAIQYERNLNLGELKTYDPGIRMGEGGLETFRQPTSIIGSMSIPSFPVMTNSSTGSSNSPSNKATNFLEKNDIVKAVLDADKSVVKFQYENLKKGDIIELPYSLYTAEADKDLGKLYSDSDSYHLYKGAEHKREDKKVRVEILEDDENVFSFKILEPIHVGVNQYVRFDLVYLNDKSSSAKPEKWVVKQVLRDNWIDNLNNNKTRLFDMFKPGVSTDSYQTDRALVMSVVRGDKTLKSEGNATFVHLNRNAVIGESTTGTLRVKYVDEVGKEIQGHPMETIAENKPWHTVVKITPKPIDNYDFVRSSSALQTVVGSGENVISLIYKKKKPVDPYENIPIKEELTKVYEPDPSLDPGTQRIDKQGKPKKTQGDRLVDPGEPQVIKVGTKPKIVEEEIPFNKTTKENPNVPEGESRIIQEGKNGKKKTTTTYEVDPKTGKVTPNNPTVETTPPVDEITEIGTGKDKDGDLVITYVPDPESPEGTETIVEEGRKPKYDVTGKEKDPGKPKVVKVGTKPKVEEEEIPFNKTTQENPNVPEGESRIIQEGKNGKKKTTTTYEVDPKTGKVTPNNPTVETTPPVDEITEIGTGKDKDGDLVITYVPDPESPEGTETIVEEGRKPKYDVTGKEKDPGKPKVVKVGTKPKVEEEEIPFKEVVIENPSKPEGHRAVLKEGKIGKKTTTTTYSVDPQTGKVTPNEPTVSIVKAEDALIEIGTGKNFVGEIETRYVPDVEIEFGKTKIVQNGTPEVKDVTGKIVTPGTPTIIHIGTKPKVEEEELDFKVVKRDNPELPKGQEKVVQEGEKGKKTITTTYEVDPQTGKVTSNVTVETKDPQDKIIEVGTKEEAKVVTPAPEAPKTPQAPAPHPAKAELPNTGEKASSALMVAGLAMMAMTVGFVAKGRKEED